MSDAFNSNSVAVLQNDEENLRVMRARQGTYRRAYWALYVQLAFTVGVPVIGTGVAFWHPEIRPYFALLVLLVIPLDVVVLDPLYKGRLKLAARLGETFDCAVLDLPWNGFVAGEKVAPEEIVAAFRADRSGNYRDWYPVLVPTVPMRHARLICQRSNAYYERRLRRVYAWLVVGLAALAAIAGLGYVLFNNMPAGEAALMATPFTPFLNWAAREWVRQRQAAEQSEALMKEVMRLLAEAKASQGDEAGSRQSSRVLQDAIFQYRVGAPLILPGLYKLLRSDIEDEMNAGAQALVKELLAASH